MRNLVAAAVAALALVSGGSAMATDRGVDSALDTNDPYFVDTNAPPPPMRFAEQRSGSMAFTADGALFCRGKQCPLTKTAAGEPLCCPQTDHCCPATYKCDESDVNAVKCIPTATTPTTNAGTPETTVTVAGNGENSAASEESSEAAAPADAENSAPSADAAEAAAAEESTSEDAAAAAESSGAAAPAAAAAAESSEEATPKFRQNIIIVKNINVLTKMNQKSDDASSGSEESSEESSEDSQSS